MTVRKNCADVLRQVRHFKTSTYYWIDAICINQQDIPEKNVQVARMGAIYGQAHGVLACIGMHNESSRFVVSMFESFHAHLSRRNTSVSVLTEEMSHLWEVLDTTGQRDDFMSDEDDMKGAICHDSCVEWVQGIDDGAFHEFLLSVLEVAKRPWFWRIWTLQELWVTDKILFFCGLDELHLPTLLLWWGDWVHLSRVPYDLSLTASIDTKVRIYAPDHLSNGGFQARLGYDYKTLLSQRQSGLREGLASTIQPLTLHQLVNICRERQCQDRRDVIYGTLTMGNWTSTGVKMPDGSYHTEQVPIIPDYNLSAFELAKVLMPGLREPYAMVLICKLLHVGPRTEEIKQAMALRSLPWPQIPVSASMDTQHWSKYSGSLASIQMSALQLGTDARHHVEETSEDLTRIMRSAENGDGSDYVAIACGRARNGDWLLMHSWHGQEGLVLQEFDGFLFFIGKALFRQNYSPKCRLASVWLDAEDAVVLMSSRKISLSLYHDDDDLRDNVEEVLAHLNDRVCREWGSSFAMLRDESESDAPDHLGFLLYDPRNFDSENSEPEDHESENCDLEGYKSWSDLEDYDSEQPSSPLISD